MTATKIDLKHLLETTGCSKLLQDLVGVLQFEPNISETGKQVLIEMNNELDRATEKANESLYCKLDLLANQLTLAIPEYEIVLEHNPSTRQDYVLVERIDSM